MVPFHTFPPSDIFRWNFFRKIEMAVLPKQHRHILLEIARTDSLFQNYF